MVSRFPSNSPLVTRAHFYTLLTGVCASCGADSPDSLLSGLFCVTSFRTRECPNGLILGTPGSGKSFAAKREIANVYFVTDDENPLSLKSDFILSLCELIVGGKDSLQPVEKTIIDRCVRMVYRDYLNDPKPENMPILED